MSGYVEQRENGGERKCKKQSAEKSKHVIQKSSFYVYTHTHNTVKKLLQTKKQAAQAA